MKIFDPHIRSRTQSDADLKNLAYFGTARVVSCATVGPPKEGARELIEAMEAHAGGEVRRLERCGLDAGAALGVLPPSRPRRAHYEVWKRLPELLALPTVVALGEIGVWEDSAADWELFESQVAIAQQVGVKAMIVTPPRELRVTLTYKMMQRLEKLGVEPGRVLMTYVDEKTLVNVVQSGFGAGLAVGATTLNPRQAAEVIMRAAQELGAVERIALSSALRVGGADLLAIPKTVEALRALGSGERELELLTWENAKTIVDGERS
ncbi:hypothetical protein DL240_12510 [Lujinxingia litoralis]|uniref:Uncharacterized protein n=1 Tax=Lujinxingia litoralis TaxID=2211119 RepID=A0A328C5U2_9DELT|nr:hypothetical protein [Lujinxingia litoralis]RAL21671.1 hypothetical protein DL240_12510 [Lujinxingia litoralis]